MRQVNVGRVSRHGQGVALLEQYTETDGQSGKEQGGENQRAAFSGLYVSGKEDSLDGRSITRLQAPNTSFDETVLGDIDATSAARTAALYSRVDQLLCFVGILPAFTWFG